MRLKTTRHALPSSVSPWQRSYSKSSMMWTGKHNQNADNLLDRSALNPNRGENSQSGTDNEVASHDAPFDPSNTSPESEMEATANESRQRNKTNNPLDISPANKDINQTGDSSKEPADRGADRLPSARGWTRKNKPVNEEKH
ncbi:hypothetical protein BGW36DRAFT_421486 [Talaromyces proteolyticus]|uniref:Uncharacterized protein n=1 Tax=Talaromyces proteolyticus TaxID=1131652 RepID=A0AAD4L1J0_9EURO|nr:uncharacterized protein BGW36DRAFT_421486 [Talaromyces proteolyticus]KAH8704901.1 hypothetical protein BGW36DRAFT_421486 [Talaromyces proteolyticus]